MATPDAPNDPQDDTSFGRSSLQFPVVGIGGSAGGLLAIRRLFENMPAKSGMAFVVVLHFSPDHESVADAIIQRSTGMRVREVLDDMAIEPNCVYVIPPGKGLVLNDGHLRLAKLERTPTRHLAIDVFFRSLGEVHRKRSIAVVLSGTGADGAQGLKRVKECGGVTFVQSPADAEYETMPLNAIASGSPDCVLPVVDMPQALVNLWSNARCIELPRPPDDLTVLESTQGNQEQSAEEALKAVLNILRQRTGHDFSHYKRATVLRRLERRLQVTRQSTLPRYLAYLQDNANETALLQQDMLISVTNFFRDREAFDALERGLYTDLRTDPSAEERLRAWAAGCATGEEAYSLAMLLLEHASDAQRLAGVQVFATDIDERALSVGRAGVYAESIAEDLAPARLRRFFTHEPGQYQVANALRERVLFSAHNLLRDPPFSRLDVVCCRNLLIYLDRTAQRKVLEVFHFSLRPGGLLFLGSAETTDAAPEHFTAVDRKYRLYRANDIANDGRVSSDLGKTLTYREPHLLSRASTRRQVLEEIRSEVLAQSRAPAAVVDPHLQVAHLSDEANRYLRLRSGELSDQLLQLVLPELRLPLQAAIAEAQQTCEEAHALPVRLQRDKGQAVIQMTVLPVTLQRHAEDGKGWLVILFDETDAPIAESDAAPLPIELDPAAVHAGELQSLRDQLAAAVGKSSNSENALRLANQELQSLNEELRSTSEELETSKEELQSVNEELMTVNLDLKLHLEASAQLNDDLKNFIAAGDIATVFVDRNLRIQRFTPRAAGIFNLLAADVDRPLFDLNHRLDYPQMEADARATFESLQPLEREVQSADGRWFLARMLPYRAGDDRIQGAVLNFIDVTARHKAEGEVRAGEERLRLLFESSADYVIILLDSEGRITSWSKGAEMALGYTEAEAVGQSVDIIFTPEDRAARAPDEERRHARDDGRAQDERWHLRKDGSRAYFSGVMVPLGSDAEKGYAKIARDLTQARLAEQQRDALLVSEQSLRIQLQTAIALKDEFLAVMSHELKNPLNLIALNADLLGRLPEARASTAVARIAGKITASVKSQGQLIDDLLDLSRLQTGKLALRLQRVDVAEVTERIVSALQAEAQTKKVALTLHVDARGHCLSADTVRIEQIVWNLLINALKFTPQGGTVRVALKGDDSDVRLEVSDTGIGIQAEFLPQLFEIFRQADAGSTTRGKGGLGIGLAIVKQLAEAHGGNVSATSPGRGQGSTFVVTLPRKGVQSVHGEVSSNASTLSGMNILLIDDDRSALDVLAQILEAEGASLTLAADAEEALRSTAAGPFDLIVSDIGMPGMDGYELLARLRSSGLRDVPAFAVTGFARPRDRERAFAAGFVEHFSKPFALEAFIDAIQRLKPGEPGRGGAEAH